MKPIRVVNRTRGTVLGGRVLLADDLMARMRGFLFRTEPSAGEGILLSPCQAVHMFGMRFPLDVVFIDESGTVVATHPDLRPWKWTGLHRKALHALELPAGTILGTGTRTGDALSWATAGAEADGVTSSARQNGKESTPSRRPA